MSVKTNREKNTKIDCDLAVGGKIEARERSVPFHFSNKIITRAPRFVH